MHPNNIYRCNHDTIDHMLLGRNTRIYLLCKSSELPTIPINNTRNRHHTINNSIKDHNTKRIKIRSNDHKTIDHILNKHFYPPYITEKNRI